MEQNPIKIQSNTSERKLLGIRSRLFQKTLEETIGYFDIYKENRDYEQLKKLLYQYLIKKGIPGLKDQLRSALDQVKPPDADMNILDIANFFIEIMLKILAENLTLEEIEAGSRQSHLEKGQVELGRGIFYEIVNQREGGREINLHIPTTFFDSSREALESFKKGLEKLAYILKTNPGFSDIKEIFGTSYLVSQKPRLARSLGFDVDTEYGNILMTKEKLLELYGPKDEK